MVVAVVMAVVSVIVIMAVLVAMVMVMVMLFGRQRLDAGGGFGVGGFALFDGAHDFAFFQTQAVEQHQFGGGDFFGIAAVELVGVGVLVGADQRTDADALATDLLGHVAQNAEAADYLQRFGRRGGVKAA